MDGALFVALNAAEQTMLAMTANNVNLANANTTAFKSDLIKAQSLAGSGYETETRIYSVAESGLADTKPGSIVSTGNPLDIAIADQGWLSVQTLGGEEVLTRNGQFKLTPEGQLTLQSGEYVLGNGGPIALPPAEKIDIAPDGTISLRPLGAAPDIIVVVDRLKLVNPPVEQLRKQENGFFALDDATIPEFDETVRVVPEAIESSNVNMVESLVKMIELSRQYDMQLNMIKTLKENDQESAQIMQ